MFQNLDIPPDPISDLYRQADFVELSCLLHPEKALERDEVASLYGANADTNDLNDFNMLDDNVSANSDLQLSRVNMYLEHIQYRSLAFSKVYPFSYSHSSGELCLRDNIDDYQKQYIYLLLASSLRNIDNQTRSSLTEDFEQLCAQALRLYLGGAPVVRRFGKGKNSDYSGGKYEKISQLAKDIFESAKVKIDDFYPGDTGDEGLDLVAWFPVHDDSPNRLLVFAQCACGVDWTIKQSSSGFDKWDGLISLTTRPVNTLFIPYCFRDASGAWYQPQKIHKTVMFDRLRLMRLLDSVSSPIRALSQETLDTIKAALDYRDDW